MIIRAEKALEEALLSLCKEKHLDIITIKDILARSGAARQTFYNHFKDKYDLINYIYRSEADRLLDIFNRGLDWHDTLLEIYTHFYNYKYFYIQAIKMDGQNCFFDYMQQNTISFYTNTVIRKYGKDIITDELLFIIKHTSYGDVNICREWMLKDMDLPIEDMADYLIACIPTKLSEYLLAGDSAKAVSHHTGRRLSR